MDKEQNRVSFIIQLLSSFATIFTVVFITLSLIIMLLTRYVPDMQNTSSLFVSGSIGLTFHFIFQIAGFSLILSIIKVLLFNEDFFPKMRFFWRSFILLLLTLITFSIFAIIFNWLPVNDPMAWLGFIVSSVVCFSIAFGLVLLKLKLEGKKYGKLLANYKASKKIDN
jgi:magnesium-transporting ATPase (P-type)